MTEVQREIPVDTVIDELRRVWARNPHKTLMQVLTRATRDVNVFLPEDASDRDVYEALASIGRGQAAPEGSDSSCSSCGA